MKFIYPNSDIIFGLSNSQDVVSTHDRRFTTSELLEIFEGWYTLSWAYDSKDGGDYYIITKELYGIEPEDYPPYNYKASITFNRDVYGLAIICKGSLTY